jgi:thioredoxin reductase/bacterioferritin-associated ferredoxin
MSTPGRPKGEYRSAQHEGSPMSAMLDVIVLGAGPAGAAAAVEAARRGLQVLVLDEAATAGGQVYRTAPGICVRKATPERKLGDALRATLAAARVDMRFGHRVWQVERDAGTFAVHAVHDAGPVTLSARALIVAGGALERHIPVDGWDRPGVIGLAGATVLLKAQCMLPGRNVVVAGAGPLLLAVAAGIVHGGGQVAAVVDLQPRRRWLRDWDSLAARPDLLARGARWMATLLARRTPMYGSSALRRIDGSPVVSSVVVAPLDAEGHVIAGAAERTIACDAVCLGFGLHPATDITRLLGATHAFDAARGGWHAVTDPHQATSITGLFVCGDAAGIAGAAAAPWSGRVAAVAVDRYLGHVSESEALSAAAPLCAARDRAARFGRAMTRVATGGDGIVATIAPETPVCLCERVTRATIDAAVDAGATTLSEVKSATRCGMGPCGGRVCEDAAARLIALRTRASRDAVGMATGRPPLRPVPLEQLAGDFDYDALPIAQPSPL